MFSSINTAILTASLQVSTGMEHCSQELMLFPHEGEMAVLNQLIRQNYHFKQNIQSNLTLLLLAVFLVTFLRFRIWIPALRPSGSVSKYSGICPMEIRLSSGTSSLGFVPHQYVLCKCMFAAIIFFLKKVFDLCVSWYSSKKNTFLTICWLLQ